MGTMLTNTFRIFGKTSLKLHRSSRFRSYATTAPTFLQKPVRIIQSKSHNALINLATEEYIFTSMDASRPVMFLWRNGPTVVIGRNQNPWKECKVNEMEKDGVTLARRKSGGGAVYQDLGNSIFTFLSSKEDNSLDRNFQLLQRAIDSLGVKCEFTGRNDIVIGGKKISGSAFKNTKDRCLHHGTVLLDVRKDDVEKYLNVNKLKLKSKGVDSVRQRITNLTDFVPELTNDDLSKALIREFCTAYGQDPKTTPIEEITEKQALLVPEITSIYQELSSWDWRFGKTPEFEHNIETRFQWGIIDLYMNTSLGKITQVKVYSDCLYPILVDAVESSLPGKSYDSIGMIKAMEDASLVLKDSPAASFIPELQAWLIQSI